MKRSVKSSEAKPSWCVYLIASGSRTYIGSSTDPRRRLRQHNGEIRGGARATRWAAGRWKLVLWISGFENRSAACRWEKLVKSRARGLDLRKTTLVGLLDRICPPGRYYEVPSGLSLHYTDDEVQFISSLKGTT